MHAERMDSRDAERIIQELEEKLKWERRILRAIVDNLLWRCMPRI